MVRLLLPSALLAGLLFVTAPAKANPGNSPAFEELDGTWVYTLTLIEFDKAGDFPIAEYIDGRSFVIDARPDGTGSLLFFSEPRDLTHNSTQKTAEGRWDLIREDVMSDGSLSIYEFLETITYERGFIEIKEAYSFYNELTLGLIPGIPADQQNMQRLPRQWVNTITHTYHGTVSLENGNYIIKGEHRMEASSNPDDPNYFISLEQTNYIRSTWEAIKIDAGTTPPPPGEPPGDYPGAPFYILPGLGGLGSIPGPDGYVQAVAGILLPGLLSILLGALGSAGGAPLAPTPPLSPSGGGPYLFDDGREYYEGRNYTIQVGDSCTEYRVVDGDLVPVRELRSGEAYIDVDGNPKIWIGGQSWHEEDWRRQAATNRGYKAAHDADWAVESTRLNPDMVASQQQYELEKAATDKEIGEQRDKVRELLRESIRVQQSINELRRDIADSSARFADRVTRTLEATKYVCDKVIDLAAKIPGPKGVAFKGIRKAYRATAAMAGGVGQGMATGNWTDSMIDATGEAVGNLIEDSIQTDRYKKGFEVFRGGAGEAWRQGREAYRKGESVLGSATTGFVEGAASEASKKAKEALKEFAPGSQYAYTIGESAFKAGYKEYKKSGDVGAVMRAAGSGYVDGAIDAAVEFGIGNIFDNLIPETGAVDEKTIQSHMEDYQTAQDTFKELGFADFADYSGTWADKMEGEWRPDFIYDQVREEAKKLATKSTQNVAKGKAFDHELYK